MDLAKFFRDNEDWKPFADLVAVPPTAEELQKEYPDISTDVLAKCMEFVSECGGVVSRGAIYLRVRREDKRCKYAEQWATMLALQHPPACQTTDTFWKGRKPWHEVFGDSNGKKNNTYIDDIRRTLAKNGVNLKANDEYMPELARFKGDPEAVVPFGGARSYIKNLCEKRGWGCEGAVNVKHRKPDKDLLADENCVPMAPDLVRQKGRQMVQQNESLKRLSRQELRERVLEKHGPSKTKAIPTGLE